MPPSKLQKDINKGLKVIQKAFELPKKKKSSSKPSPEPLQTPSQPPAQPPMMSQREIDKIISMPNRRVLKDPASSIPTRQKNMWRTPEPLTQTEEYIARQKAYDLNDERVDNTMRLPVSLRGLSSQEAYRKRGELERQLHETSSELRDIQQNKYKYFQSEKEYEDVFNALQNEYKTTEGLLDTFRKAYNDVKEDVTKGDQITGNGVGRKSRFQKGSVEAKQHMEYLRSLRGKK